MLDPRRSYLKTVLTAGLATLAGLVLLGWLMLSARRGAATWPPVLWLPFAAAVVVIVLAVAGFGLLVVGGSIAIHRTGLEERGLPYARTERREWLPGPLTRPFVEMLRRARALLRGGPPPLRPGDVVEVRSLREILRTLDERAMLDGLPFMREMAAHCGERFRVFRRVEKIHDYVTLTGLRSLRSAVLLEELRCDGSGHGGCEARCHIIWKEAWLRRVPAQGRGRPAAPADPETGPPADGADLERLWADSSQVRDESGEVRFVCQMTEVARASSPLSWGDPRHYLRDLVYGNARPGPWLRGVALAAFNGVQRRRGGVTFPHYENTGQKVSPHAVLDLQPGEMVRVRTKREIEATLTIGRRNRGLWFDGEMVRFCGGAYRVASRVDRLIDEKSGAAIKISNPCIVLEDVTSSGEYLALCAQNEVIMWREIWLERIP